VKHLLAVAERVEREKMMKSSKRTEKWKLCHNT